MHKLPSSKKIIKVLEEKGFKIVSQKGSHIKLYSEKNKLTVIVPFGRKQIPLGTLSSILRQSKLSKKDFI